MSDFKHLNQFGQVISDELRGILDQIDEIISPLMQDCTPIEALVIAKHIQSTVSYQASSIVMRKQLEDFSK